MRKGALHRARKKAGLSPGTLVFPEQSCSQGTLFHFDADTLERQDSFSLPDLRASLIGGRPSWLSIPGLPGPELLAALAEALALPPLIQEDLLNTDHTPKVEEYDHGVFLVLKMLDHDEASDRLDVRHACLLLHAGGVVSIHAGDRDPFASVVQRLEKGGRLRRLGPAYLAYALMDSLVDQYLVVLEGLGERLLTLEEEQMAAFDPAQQKRIHHYRRELLLLRKTVRPLREVLVVLRGDDTVFGDALQPYLRDLAEHVAAVLESVETYRELVVGLLDLHLAQAGQRMNEIMKVLTVIATLFIPLTFIVGIYGMNFTHMPELGWRWGYAGVWGVMLAIVVGMGIYFRRKGWF